MELPMLMFHTDRNSLERMKSTPFMEILENIFSEYLENVFQILLLKKINVAKDRLNSKIKAPIVKLI